LQKLLLICIVKATQTPAAFKVVVNSRFVPMLLKYLAPEPSAQRPWSKAQYEELQLQVCIIFTLIDK
jgi:hypothetical protein